MPLGGLLAKTKQFQVLIVSLLLAGIALPAHADPIVVDPNSFAVGTDLSSMFTNLTMARLTNTSSSPVLGVSSLHTDGGLSLGGTAFDVNSYDACSTGSILCGPYNVLELRFANPTNFVQIDTLGFTDGPGLLAFDILGNRIDLGGGFAPFTGLTSVVLLPGSRYAATQTLSREHADIARIVYGGYNGTTTAARLAYNVPEPATLAILSMGLFGAAFLTRRRRTDK